jgi:hypothetical protein
MFSSTRPIRKKIDSAGAAASASLDAKDPAREFLELWTEKTVMITGDTFPFVSSRSKVHQTFVFEISPIENAILAVRGKNRELVYLESKYSALASKTESSMHELNVSPFTMALNGVVDAPVNGGIPLYKKVFLNVVEKSANAEILEAAILEQVCLFH